MLRGYFAIPGILRAGLVRGRSPVPARFLNLCLGPFLAVLLSAPLAAQTTGELSGVVSDDRGQPLAGALISIESPFLIAPQRTQISDKVGRFTFPSLPIGTYQVTVELEGSATQQVEEVEITVKKTTNLHVRLSPSTVLDQINVTSRTPVVDPTQISQSQVFDLEYLETATIGLLNRDYLDVIK